MPKVVDPDQRRSEIVMALWQVIYAHGIDGVSFRTVAEEAGVSVGRLQHYFPSKDEMILHGCRQMVAAAVADHGPHARTRGALAARAELVDLASGALADGDEFRMGAAVWAAYQAKAVSHPEIAAVVVDALKGRTHALALLLAAARAPSSQESPEPTAAEQNDALRLASLSEGFTQRVIAGAMSAEQARRMLRDEVARYLEP